MQILEVPVTEKMGKFIWSPSSLDAFCGSTKFEGGCGVRVYLDRFAGPTVNVWRKHFSFGTAMHEILEEYHVFDEKSPLSQFLDVWLPDLWIASEYKKKLKKLFGEQVVDKLEKNEFVSVGDFDSSARILSPEQLALSFPNVQNFALTLMRGEAKRWMFLGFDSELDERLFYDKAVNIFKGYHQREYIKPLSIEDSMLIQLNGISVRGKIDKVDAGTKPDTYRVIDYKTSKKMKTTVEMEHDFQMVCYHTAVREKYNVANKDVEVGLLYLKPETKIRGEYMPKPIELRTVSINQHLIDKATATIETADRMVRSGRFHYVDKKGKWKCPWCDHYQKCGYK